LLYEFIFHLQRPRTFSFFAVDVCIMNADTPILRQLLRRSLFGKSRILGKSELGIHMINYLMYWLWSQVAIPTTTQGNLIGRSVTALLFVLSPSSILPPLPSHCPPPFFWLKLKQFRVEVCYISRGFQELEAPRFLDKGHMKLVSLSALLIGRLYPQEMCLVLISVRGWIDPEPYCGREDYVSGKFLWHKWESNPRLSGL
jgi:hypothetical protein